MILFCKLVYAYDRKICEDKFGGWKKSFSVFEFEATEYSIRIRNFEDIQFDIRFE